MFPTCHAADSRVAVKEKIDFKGGEVHCGTAARRLLSTPSPWWNENAIKAKWGNEK